MEFCPSDESQLDQYFRQVAATPLLTPDEEMQLVYRIEDGDSEARQSLICANLWLVIDIARRYADGRLSLLKLLQEGHQGLLLAVEAYDPSKGARFAEFANHWVEDAIRCALSPGNHDHS